MNKEDIEKNTIRVALIAVAAIFLLLLTGGATVLAADESKPGDILHPADKYIETVQRGLTTDPVAQVELEMSILEERVEELDEIGDELEESPENEDLGDDFEEAIDEVENQEALVEDEVEDLEESASEGEIDESSKERIVNRIQVQMEEHLELMLQLQEKMEEKENEQAALSLEKAAQRYEENRTRTMENLQRVGEAKELKEKETGEDSQTPPGQEKKEGDDSATHGNSENAPGHSKNDDGTEGPDLEE